MKRVALGVLLACMAAGCQRVPEEPVGRTSGSTTTMTSTATGTSTPTSTATSISTGTAIPTTTATSTAAPAATGREGLVCPATAATVAHPAPAPAGARCPPDPDRGGPLATTVTVSFPDAKGAPRVVAELARTPAEIQRGLMYRTKMPEDRGMLFRMQERKEQVFWMHNTCIPLDMLFVDDDGTIVGVVENAPTLDDGERTVQCPSKWVLEVNAGYCKRHGVKPGQKLAIPSEARSAK